MINIDWTLIITGFIAAIPPTLIGIAILRQGKRTHSTFNSKMDDMLRLTEKAAFAAGRKAEKDSDG
jgi:hypothetical protein